jgi:hypothetical protein
MQAPGLLERILDKVCCCRVTCDVECVTSCVRFMSFNVMSTTTLQLQSLTWRFCCTCIVLAAGSGYIMLGALQIASADTKSAAVAAAAGDGEHSGDNDVVVDDDDDGSGDDDDDEDGNDAEGTVRHSEADQGKKVAAGPQGGAGAAAATALLPFATSTTSNTFHMMPQQYILSNQRQLPSCTVHSLSCSRGAQAAGAAEGRCCFKHPRKHVID